ncbi:hypothetical protein LTR84_006733 [Exophiala bonariae]|uniref:Xylanolytic transcriptional activator regulatory domain-containing protein n=1 Tax=Exophiala bonariae TaxID=1690606 RepID=A0AAV9N011_9EURO|nr:hypothetical protein LTR84_006733 [Exophiala bonariae]
MEELLSFNPLDSPFAIQSPVGKLYDFLDDPESFPLDESASIWGFDPASLDLTNYLTSPSPECVEYGSPSESQSIIPEHFGPGCWLSLCSSSGLAWVQQAHGTGDFATIAGDLTAAWAKQLRLERNEPTIRSAEPEQRLALEYVDAYFKRSVDSLFEAIHQLDFQQQLRSHFENPNPNEDPVSYAIRNTVYASGCRLHSSANYAASFDAIQKEAWGYFSNALSVHSELLLRSPSIGAVRALLAMALFAEGLGSPALGSGLIANAALVAQALGLHKRVTCVEATSKGDGLKNTWLFWAVYCCEKNISRRIGRSSVIVDDDVTCEIPIMAHPNSALDPIFLTSIIQNCQISSGICKALSARGLHDQPARLLEIVRKYNQELLSWETSLAAEMRPRTCYKYNDDVQLSRTLAIILLHCSFCDLLMILNAPFAYPWINSGFRKDSNGETKIAAQISESSATIVESARKIIVMTRHFDLNGANTHSFMLHYPMHAFINLFIHVLKSPASASVRSDMALLDVAVGYFGQLDFLTGSKLEFPFARDIAVFARRTVDNYPGHPSQSTGIRGSGKQ